MYVLYTFSGAIIDIDMLNKYMSTSCIIHGFFFI